MLEFKTLKNRNCLCLKKITWPVKLYMQVIVAAQKETSHPSTSDAMILLPSLYTTFFYLCHLLLLSKVAWSPLAWLLDEPRWGPTHPAPGLGQGAAPTGPSAASAWSYPAGGEEPQTGEGKCAFKTTCSSGVFLKESVNHRASQCGSY